MTARTSAVVTLAWLAAAPRAAHAQAILGVGEDATLPAPGQLRVRVPLTFGSARERAGGPTGGGSGRVPLGTEFGLDAISPARVPALTAIRDSVRAAAANPALDLSLGTLRTRARLNTTRAPILVELGVARRIAVSALIPYTQTRPVLELSPNVGGGSGNFGLNPALGSDAAASAARQQTAAALTNLTNAAASARAQCPSANAGAGCAGTLALATQAELLQQQLARIYGSGSTSGGLPYVPLANSDAQRAVAARIAQLGAQFRAAGVTGFEPNSVPAPSLARIGLPGLLTLINNPASGVAVSAGIPPFGSQVRGGLGDVELAASVMVLDTFGGDARDGGVRARVTPAPGLRVRTTLSGGFRVATGLGANPFLVFDVPPSDRAAAVIGRATADVAVGRRASASVAARVAVPVADRRTLVIPLAPGEAFSPAFARREVERRLGREVELELTPRYAFGEAFGIVAQGVVRDRGAARFSGTYTLTADETGGEPVTLDASTLAVGSAAREIRVGFGAVYSTLAAASRRRTRVPVEVGYLRSATVSASLGAVPYTTTHQLSLRVYARLLGR